MLVQLKKNQLEEEGKEDVVMLHKKEDAMMLCRKRMS